MKRLSIFLILIVSGFVQAQVHIGNEAGTSYFFGPVNAYYGYSYIQNIYKASDINASGEITALTFEMENDNAIENTDNNIDVWIGHTNKEAFDSTTDWVDVTTLTQVLTDGTITKDGTTVTFTFDIPFNYNGIDNLILVYDANEDGYDDSLDKFYYSTNNNDENVTIYYRNDTTNPDVTTPPTATNTSANYPDITFVGITQSCPAPVDLTATDVTTSSAIFGWTESGAATTWNIQYGENGFTLGEGTTVNGLNVNSYALDGLTDGTFYDFYVQADCGTDDLSSWAGPFTFNTIAENATPPYATSFESGIAAGWSTEVISGNEWESYESEPNANTGSNSIRYNYNSSEAADSWIFTIGIILEANKEYDVSFFQKVSSASFAESLKLTVGTEANAAAQTTTLLDLPEMDNATYSRRRALFVPDADGVYYFGLQAYSEADQLAIIVDDFSVRESTLFSLLDSENGYNNASADWGDYDNDGDVDLLMSGQADYADGASTTRVYDNDGNGNFTPNESIQLLGVHSGEPRWVDYDNDGDLDIAVVGMSSTAGVNQFALYRNDEGVFTNVDSNTNGASFNNVSLGDYDHDGDVDLLFSGYTESATYILNNTENGFERIDLTATIPGIFDGRTVWADVDNDTDLDIIIAGNTQAGSSNLRIYMNNDGVYTEGQVLSDYRYKIPVVGDFDNDGDLDIASKGYDDNYDDVVLILINNDGNYIHHSELLGLSTNSGAQPIDWGDYDNDGDLDLAVTGTDSDYEGAVILYTNDNGTFVATENTGMLPVGSHVAKWQDVDGDLNADIIISGLHTDPVTDDYYGITKIYKNETTAVNTAPVAPTELTSTVENGIVTFNWLGAHDAQTATEGLQYHITVGTTSGSVDIAHYPVHGNQWMLQNLPENTETLYWCVKSMDTAFIMSECSEMQTVSNLGTNDIATTVEGIKLYPNPVKDGIVRLSTNDLQGEDVEVFIYNVTGKLLFAKDYDNAQNKIEIPVNAFVIGTYFLTYKTGKETNSIQFIVK